MIFLDMDGVCVDIHIEILRYNGIPVERLQTYPKGEWYLEKALNCPVAFCDETEWWRNLPETPWFKELYSILHQMDEVYFLSSPKAAPHAASGKILWLQDRFGADFRHFILTSHKHIFARPDAILFDDREKYCEDFIRAGGRAIVVPSIGNSVPEPEDMVAYLLEEYQRVASK